MRMDEPGRRSLEMMRAYVQFFPKVRRVDEYDAVLVNREATLIGPALVERWVRTAESHSSTYSTILSTSRIGVLPTAGCPTHSSSER